MSEQHDSTPAPEDWLPIQFIEKPTGVSVITQLREHNGRDEVVFEVWSNGRRPWSYSMLRIGGKSRLFQVIHDRRVARSYREAYAVADSLAHANQEYSPTPDFSIDLTP